MSEKIAGEYHSTPRVLSDGQTGNIQITSTGEVKVAQVVSGAAITSANPQPVVTQPNEVLAHVSTTSGQVIGSGVSIAGAVPLSGGFVSGANFAKLVDLNVAAAGSQGATITATILRGSVSTASVVAAGSATSISLVDAGQVVGQETLTAQTVPGAGSGSGASVWRQSSTVLNYVVPNGGAVVFTAGSGGITMPGSALSSGVTVGIGIGNG